MDNEDDEWGPWIDHDGKGKPVQDGVILWRKYANGYEWIAPMGQFTYGKQVHYAGQKYGCSWEWSTVGFYTPVVAYRIKKPKGLKILEGLLENLPTKPEDLVKEKEYEYVER